MLRPNFVNRSRGLRTSTARSDGQGAERDSGDIEWRTFSTRSKRTSGATRRPRSGRNTAICIVGAALLLVLAVAAHWGWTKYTTNQQLQASADFLSAAATKDLKAREAALGKIAAEGGTYGVLARFRLAETAIEGGDKAKARGILGEIAKDGGADKALRDLALIQAALLELEIGKPEAAADLVKDLTKEGEAYRLSALEVTGLAAVAAGDNGKGQDDVRDPEEDGGGGSRARARASRSGPTRCSIGSGTDRVGDVMSGFRGIARAQRRRGASVLAVGAALLLTGCRWFGEDDKPPLPGDRVSALQLNRQLNVDPELAGTDVILSEPYANKVWAQSGGNQTHAMYHLKASASALQQVWSADIGASAERRQPPAGGAGGGRRRGLRHGCGFGGERARRRERQPGSGART